MGSIVGGRARHALHLKIEAGLLFLKFGAPYCFEALLAGNKEKKKNDISK